MAESSYDCVVIGSGPGGYVAAIRAAQLGKRTAVVEKDKVGGRCLNYACIPAKAVLRSADLLTEVREAGEYGLSVTGVEVDYPAIQGRRERVVSTLTSGVGGLFKKNNIDSIEGEASLAGRAGAREGSAGGGGAGGAGGNGNGGAGGGAEGIELRVGEQTLTAASVILATGSVKRPIPGVEFGGRVIGTEQAWALQELPVRLAVVGAGASGAEIASGFARLGSEVMLFEVLDRVLPTEDTDISRLVERGLKRQGIAIHTGTPIEDVRPEEDCVRFTYRGEAAQVDYLVIAAGRGPDVQALGLEAAGVELDERGLIEVDGAQRTSAAGIYAIGDLVRGPALAHKASDEGIIAAEDSAGLATHPLSYVDIPRATFCTPNVGSFGLTEEQAREQGHDVVVGKVPYGAVGGGTVYGDRTGLVKLVGERKYGELLGGHIVGSRATELIQELVNVRLLEGGYPEVARIVHGHPTLSEAVMEAGRAADGWLIHG
jgi:dihydrolipoyl dehydrogenase